MKCKICVKWPKNRVSWEKNRVSREKIEFFSFLVKSRFPQNAQKKACLPKNHTHDGNMIYDFYKESSQNRKGHMLSSLNISIHYSFPKLISDLMIMLQLSSTVIWTVIFWAGVMQKPCLEWKANTSQEEYQSIQ